jgi:hypothetical protein
MEIWPRGVDRQIQLAIPVYAPRTGIQEVVGVYVCRVQIGGFSTGSWRNFEGFCIFDWDAKVVW